MDAQKSLHLKDPLVYNLYYPVMQICECSFGTWTMSHMQAFTVSGVPKVDGRPSSISVQVILGRRGGHGLRLEMCCSADLIRKLKNATPTARGDFYSLLPSWYVFYCLDSCVWEHGSIGACSYCIRCVAGCGFTSVNGEKFVASCW